LLFSRQLDSVERDMAIGSITHFFDASGFGGLGGLKDGTTATLSAPSSVLSANVSDDDSVFNFDGDETVAAGSPVGTPGDTFNLVAVNYELTNPAGVTHAFFGFNSGGVEYFYSEYAPDDFFAQAGNYDVARPLYAALASQAYSPPITPPCFTSGSLITTDRGNVLIDNLQPGDMILTRDNGFQPLAWKFARELSKSYFNANPANRPVMLRKDSLGPNVPDRDVMVSPGHLMLVAGSSEVLVPARQLVKNNRAFQVSNVETSYIHLLFEQHQIVKVDGMWSESFQPSHKSLHMVGAARTEVFDIFPELQFQSGVDAYVAARNVAYRGDAKQVLKSMTGLYLQ
ncbi:MAG: Hint domain-containing protein, partial [Planktomarina sp.]